MHLGYVPQYWSKTNYSTIQQYSLSTIQERHSKVSPPAQYFTFRTSAGKVIFAGPFTHIIYEQPHHTMEVSHRMAGLWCVYSHRRAHGHCQLPNSDVVHLYIIPDAWLTADRIYGTCFLDEYQTIYVNEQAEPVARLISHCAN